MISGILVSPGIAFGRALLLVDKPIVIDTRKINDDEIENEIQLFKQGRAKSSQQLNHERFLIGSVSEAVARYSKCDVLIVR